MTAAWIKLIHLICTVYCHNNPTLENKENKCKTVLEKNGLRVEIKNIYSQGGALDAFLYSSALSRLTQGTQRCRESNAVTYSCDTANVSMSPLISSAHASFCKSHVNVWGESMYSLSQGSFQRCFKESDPWLSSCGSAMISGTTGRR